MIRPAKFAGKFYPEDPVEISNMVKRYIENADVSKEDAYAVIAPHAGYIYSGATCGYSFKALRGNKPDTVVFLGPNHTGYGLSISVSNSDWQTPLGTVECDNDIVNLLVNKGFNINEDAHDYEHSIEVELPFLQVLFGEKVKMVAINFMGLSYDKCVWIAEGLYDIVNMKDKNISFVVSSDFSHYLSPDIIKDVDKPAIDCIINNNSELFFETVINNRMSICGALPITILLALNERIKGEIEFLNYSHSAMTIPMEEAVGYASFAFYNK